MTKIIYYGIVKLNFIISEPNETFGNFSGVKLSCFYNTSSSENELIGECFLAFSTDIPCPPTPVENSIELRSCNKKEKDISCGLISFRSTFTGKESKKREILVQSDPAALKSVAIKRSNLIHVTASGRREIRFHDGPLNMVFGELPPLNYNKIASNEHGYDCTLALWLTTCCQLAYRDPSFIKEVVQNIWGK